jgi:hypothetical protein
VPHLPHARRLRLRQSIKTRERPAHRIAPRDPEGNPRADAQQTENRIALACGRERTRNCCGSGHERREKRLTAMRRPPSRRPR